tara:strand:+ start:4438 stop:5352 length:915 start_codon:yes stop_codon:yes gene_type:complete
MATKPNDDFEIEVEGADLDIDIEIEDDTPEQDRGRDPMPKDIVDELENDELEEYSDKVKTRLKQMKKVWHDERREKERLQREQNEAMSVTQRIFEENKRLKSTLTQGEQTLVQSWGQSAELEAEQAKRAYKEAYESGDSDRLVEAQDQLQNANYKLNQLRNYRPSIHNDFDDVQLPPSQAQVPRPDTKTMAWQERNDWWGTDPEMTATALGLHQKLENERGQHFVGSDEYWQTIDKTMSRRYPEYFGESEKQTRSSGRSASVVAPASRSTSSKKIVLKQSQLTIARKLGLTPEQYAVEFRKLEK